MGAAIAVATPSATARSCSLRGCPAGDRRVRGRRRLPPLPASRPRDPHRRVVPPGPAAHLLSVAVCLALAAAYVVTRWSSSDRWDTCSVSTSAPPSPRLPWSTGRPASCGHGQSPHDLDTDVLDGLDACREALAQTHPGAADAEVLACSSAGGGLRIAVVGNEELVTAEAGRRVALSSGGKVVAVLSRVSDDAVYLGLGLARPDVVLLTGVPTAVTRTASCWARSGSPRVGGTDRWWSQATRGSGAVASCWTGCRGGHRQRGPADRGARS